MDATQTRIDELVKSNPVVLFMKGSRTFPQCGFSARAVNVLDSLLGDYVTVNVLQEPEIRQGIKEYSDWPTIPQLYIKGEFVGGSDIIMEMAQSGELPKMLGVEVTPVEPPSITITDVAADNLKGHLPNDGETFLRFEIGAGYTYQLGLGGKQPGDVAVEAGGITVLMDRSTAQRAEGTTIDFVPGPSGGFDISNPNEPPKVKQMSVQELKALMDSGAPFELFDVRSHEERQIAKIEGARLLDEDARAHIEGLPKDTRLVFHCRSGGRSQSAAQFFLSQGFTDVHNVAGGINAWAAEIDPSVPQY